MQLEIDIQNNFIDKAEAFNTVGEIPGTDKTDEVVMLGGHLDSWHAGTGATDNAGSVAMMEAARILETLGVKPRRTIRVASGAAKKRASSDRRLSTQHFGERRTPARRRV